MEHIAFKRLRPEAILPTRAHPGDAGLDLYAAHGAVLDPGARTAVPTGWAVAIPEGWAGLVVPRSGLALKHGVTVANAPGLIDSGYRGELQVILVNLGDTTHHVAIGDRIGQLVLTEVTCASAVQVEELPESDGRDAGGLGSTGR